jgi:hypothetical protein
MATFIPGKPDVKRRHAAMQAALYHARKDRVDRSNLQIANDEVGKGQNVASTPSPFINEGE